MENDRIALQKDFGTPWTESNREEQESIARLKEGVQSGSLSFFSGNPSIDVIEGIVHIYRDDRAVQLLAESEEEISNINDNNVNNNSLIHNHAEKPPVTLPKERSQVICVLCVPSYMSPSDFARFTGSHHKSITNMRVIRNTSNSTYMVLIKCIDQKSADEFYLDFSGRQYHSMEPELCVTLFVSNVEFVKSPDSVLFPPSIDSTELPSCPVCLERLDEASSGILTILCNHSFHCACLSKWKGDNCCPVCRYCQQPESDTPVCSVCRTSESLWICLICGNVGCGRYLNEHAREHYKDTLHAYALELQTSRVWDYAGDVYVHRLAQNKSDGKLVVIGGESTDEDIPSSKIESISLEYSYLLEAQRRFFEEQIKKMQRDKNAKVVQLEDEFAHLLETKSSTEKRMKEILEEKKKLEKKFVLLEKKLKETESETEFLKEINNALKQNQNEWKEKVVQTEKKLLDDSKDKKIQELQEQIQDLMFFIEAGKKIAGNEELQNGQLIVENNNNNESPTKSNLRKKPSNRKR